MWPLCSCLAAKIFVQPLTSYLITTAGEVLPSGLNKCSLAALTHLSRIQRSLSQPSAVSVSSLQILPLRWHPFSAISNICCTYLLSQSIFTHPRPHLPLNLERLVLTFSCPLVPVFPHPLLPSSNKLLLCLSHSVPCALCNIYKPISAYSLQNAS